MRGQKRRRHSTAVDCPCRVITLPSPGFPPARGGQPASCTFRGPRGNPRVLLPGRRHSFCATSLVVGPRHPLLVQPAFTKHNFHPLLSNATLVHLLAVAVTQGRRDTSSSPPRALVPLLSRAFPTVRDLWLPTTQAPRPGPPGQAAGSIVPGSALTGRQGVWPLSHVECPWGAPSRRVGLLTRGEHSPGGEAKAREPVTNLLPADGGRLCQAGLLGAPSACTKARGPWDR